MGRGGGGGAFGRGGGLGAPFTLESLSRGGLVGGGWQRGPGRGVGN